MPPLTYIHASESARTTAGGRGVGYFLGGNRARYRKKVVSLQPDNIKMQEDGNDNDLQKPHPRGSEGMVPGRQGTEGGEDEGRGVPVGGAPPHT